MFQIGTLEIIFCIYGRKLISWRYLSRLVPFIGFRF